MTSSHVSDKPKGQSGDEAGRPQTGVSPFEAAGNTMMKQHKQKGQRLPNLILREVMEMETRNRIHHREISQPRYDRGLHRASSKIGGLGNGTGGSATVSSDSVG